jgi:hypothetical protein
MQELPDEEQFKRMVKNYIHNDVLKAVGDLESLSCATASSWTVPRASA